MGIQFSALDTTRTRTAFDGTQLPARVQLPEQWELFGFHVAGAMALLGLLEAACRFRGRTLLASLWTDHQIGAVTVVDARRAIMLARARFESVGEATADHVAAVFGALEDHPSGRVHSGLTAGAEDLHRRLEEFAAFVEAAAEAGADRIMWS